MSIYVSKYLFLSHASEFTMNVYSNGELFGVAVYVQNSKHGALLEDSQHYNLTLFSAATYFVTKTRMGTFQGLFHNPCEICSVSFRNNYNIDRRYFDSCTIAIDMLGLTIVSPSPMYNQSINQSINIKVHHTVRR